MTCRCNFHSPFLFAHHPRPSMFMQDEKFYKGASTGKTAGQISTEAVMRYEARTGRSNGSVFGISSAADHLIEKSTYERQKRKRSASHYSGRKA